MRQYKKLEKISEKELKEKREEKLNSWHKKNKRYLSLDALEEVVLNEIDPLLAKEFKSEFLGSLSINQKNELHSLLFSREKRKILILNAIKVFCGEREISFSELREDDSYFFDFMSTLDKNGISIKEPSIKKYIDILNEREKNKDFEKKTLASKLVREKNIARLEGYLKKGDISVEFFLSELRKYHESYEKNHGIKTFNDKRALSEGSGSYDEDVLVDDV